MKIAIVCGMQSEAALIGDRSSCIIVIGAGDPARLTSGLEAAIADGCTHVLSFGTCGALNPELEAGEIVIGYVPGLPYNGDWTVYLSHSTGAPLLRVTAATATIATAADKAALRAVTGADVVDLETTIAAQIAAKHNLPFAALRAVSDTADQDIPPAALAALTSSGSIDIPDVIESLAGDGSQLAALYALSQSSALAFTALPQALADIGINFGVPA